VKHFYLRLMEIHAKRQDRLTALYANADLGPLLRSEAMRPVRERFPEPGKK